MFQATEILRGPHGRTVTVTTRRGVRGPVGHWECTCGKRGEDGTHRTLKSTTVNTIVLKQAADAHLLEHDDGGAR